MGKIFIFLIVSMLALSSGTLYAEQSEIAGFYYFWDKVGDLLATVGKSPEVRAEILQQREMKRAEKYSREMMRMKIYNERRAEKIEEKKRVKSTYESKVKKGRKTELMPPVRPEEIADALESEALEEIEY